MMNIEDIQEEIIRLKRMDASRSACEQLALMIICRDELQRDFKADKKLLDTYGDSDFLKAVDGKDSAAVWQVLDDLMDALIVSNPRLYNNVIKRIGDIAK